MNRPWLTQNSEVYIKQGAWEELTDFEHWLLNQFDEENQEAWELADEHLKTGLYVVFCNLIDTNSNIIKETIKEIEYWHKDMLNEGNEHPRGNGWLRVYNKLKNLEEK